MRQTSKTRLLTKSFIIIPFLLIGSCKSDQFPANSNLSSIEQFKNSQNGKETRRMITVAKPSNAFCLVSCTEPDSNFTVLSNRKQKRKQQQIQDGEYRKEKESTTITEDLSDKVIRTGGFDPIMIDGYQCKYGLVSKRKILELQSYFKDVETGLKFEDDIPTFIQAAERRKVTLLDSSDQTSSFSNILGALFDQDVSWKVNKFDFSNTCQMDVQRSRVELESEPRPLDRMIKRKRRMLVMTNKTKYLLNLKLLTQLKNGQKRVHKTTIQQNQTFVFPTDVQKVEVSADIFNWPDFGNKHKANVVLSNQDYHPLKIPNQIKHLSFSDALHALEVIFQPGKNSEGFYATDIKYDTGIFTGLSKQDYTVSGLKYWEFYRFQQDGSRPKVESIMEWFEE